MLVVGDCRDTLARWAAEGVRVQTVVTSPPYWGLRDYGTAAWVGGDPACAHTSIRRGHQVDEKQSTSAGTSRDPIRAEDGCRMCGARRIDAQLGLEPSPEVYVRRMVDVFRLVRDVLADDGTCWLNLGDSYATLPQAVGEWKGAGVSGNTGIHSGIVGSNIRKARGVPVGLKPKDLVGIPWRVAFALQADGWYLRSDIIWGKPNPMPESVTDRPTKAHEYLFLLAKSERYYYDAAAIREPYSYAAEVRVMTPKNVNGLGLKPTRPYGFPLESNGRNRRSVWTIATQPYPEAHFATMPEDLVKPCILAGSRPGDTVLDPFMGSGTVAKVAQDLGRAWLGCELNPAYADLCRARTRQGGLVL